MNAQEAYALWNNADLTSPCTQQADDPCQYVDSDAHSFGKCKACGYVMHDIPGSNDDAHDELCCGSGTGCTTPAYDICVTHND